MHDAADDGELGDFIPPADPAFVTRMRPIVDALEKILGDTAPAPAAAPPDEAAVTVFIADVPEALQDFKDRLAAELADRGARVLADIPPPMPPEDHAAAVAGALDRSRLAIHLLNDWAGRRLAGHKDRTYPREQHALAFDHAVPQLVWVPAGLDLAAVADPAQQAFLADCETRPRSAGQYAFVRALPSEFLHLAGDRIDDLRRAPQTLEPPLSYLIDTHQKDQRYAFRLADHLLEKGAQVDFNHESSDPVVSLAKFEKSVHKVKNLVLVCGQVGAAWLAGRIRKAIKVMTERLGDDDAPLPLENIWLFLAPGGSGPPELPAFPPLIRINILDNRRSEQIDPQVTARLLAPGETP
jgi:hypothetical protein